MNRLSDEDGVDYQSLQIDDRTASVRVWTQALR